MPPPEIIAKLEATRASLEAAADLLTPDMCRRVVAKYGLAELRQIEQDYRNGINAYNQVAAAAGFPLLGDELDQPAPPAGPEREETLVGLRQLREMFDVIFAWFPTDRLALRGLARAAIQYARLRNYRVEGRSEVAPDDPDLIWAVQVLAEPPTAEQREARAAKWWKDGGDAPEFWDPSKDTDWEEPDQDNEEGTATT